MVPDENPNITLEDARKIDEVINLIRLKYAIEFLKNLHGLRVLGQKDAIIKLLIHEIEGPDTINSYGTIETLRENGIVAVKKEWRRSKVKMTPRGEKIAKFLSDVENDPRKKFLQEILTFKAAGGRSSNYDIAILTLVTQRYCTGQRPLYSTTDLWQQLKKTKSRISQSCTRLVNVGFLTRVNEKLGYRNITYKPTTKTLLLLKMFKENINAFYK